MKSVAIITKVVSSIPEHDKGYLMRHYVIKFVSGFSGTLVSSNNKTDRNNMAEILLKVALNTHNRIISQCPQQYI
jgi:hypothetical protein